MCFPHDSIAQADYGMETEKDRPRQEAQMAERSKTAPDTGGTGNGKIR